MNQFNKTAFPLSAQQSRAWRAIAAGKLSRRVEASIRISGPMERDRLQRSLETLVARHEILRTVFDRPVGMLEPLQVVFEVLKPTVIFAGEKELFEAQDSTTWTKKTRWVSHVSESETPFVCKIWPFSPNEHLLSITLFRLASDRQSFDILCADLADIYHSGDGSDTSDITQYADFSEWQRRLLESERLNTSLSECQADGLRELLPSPAQDDRRKYETASATVNLGPKANQFFSSRNPRANAAVLMAWMALLGRLSNSYEITVGVHCHGR